MNDDMNKVEAEREMLADAQSRGMGATLGVFVRLSGPGWLQSAITLGGGSLASSLFLGILAGYSLMWLQPVAMILGIIMLSAIGYVTLSTGERPFRAICQHVNPVLGWGWALAVAAANIVWCLPQYSLAESVLRQNLSPELFADRGADGSSGFLVATATTMFGEGWLADNANRLVVATVILILATIITWSYDRGGKGLRLYEMVLKIFVGLIVLCFFGVVVSLTINGGLEWGKIFSGLIPNINQFFNPAPDLQALLDKIADEPTRNYWSDLIVSKQRDVMISAAATAVGINMTFLFPYSLLRKGWTKEFRGLAIFDLSTGMFIPYVLATGCVVIAAAAQFHAEVPRNEKTGQLEIPEDLQGAYSGLVGAREKRYEELAAKKAAEEEKEVGQRQEVVVMAEASCSLAEKGLAATLVNRKANHLAKSLAPLTGSVVANLIFGFGVLAMTLSTISLLMLISGFVVAEILNYPPGGMAHKLGTLLSGVLGAFGPFVWGQAGFYLAVPTSVFGFVLLPFAYVTFVLLMNQKRLLGDSCPTGAKRVLWNLLMGVAASIASVGAIYMIWVKAGVNGIGAVVGFILLAIMVHIHNRNERALRLNDEIPKHPMTKE